LTWHYSLVGKLQEPKVEEILQEINGYRVADRKLVSGFAELKADGSTACGCWIYSGVFPRPGENRANQRNSGSLGAWLGLCLACRSPHPL
jgi:formate dehydrogenase major subunit